MSSAAAFDLEGHRGARGLAPENTLPAFAKALSIGVTTLELDVGVSEDGVVVVCHDRRLNPDIARGPDGRWLTGRTRTIRELTFQELQRYDVGRIRPGSDYSKRFQDQRRMDGVRIPRLADVFALVRHARNDAVRFNIETKISPLAPEDTIGPEEFARALIEVVRANGMASRTIVQSFDWRTLALDDRDLLPHRAAAGERHDWGAAADRITLDGQHPLPRPRLGAKDGESCGRSNLVAFVSRPHRGAREGGAGPRTEGPALDRERPGRHGPADGLGRQRDHHRLSGSPARGNGGEGTAVAERDAGHAVARRRATGALARHGAVAGEAELEVSLHVRPFASEDAVEHGVARRAVAARCVMAEDAVLLRPQRVDRPLRREVEVVGAQAHHLAPERVEGMPEEEQLAAGVDVAALPVLSVPGVADLDAIDRGDDVVIARAADDRAARDLPHRPRQHVPGDLPGEGFGDVRLRPLRFRHRREPELPEPTVRGRGGKPILMLACERLQADAVALEDDGAEVDHGRRSPVKP